VSLKDTKNLKPRLMNVDQIIIKDKTKHYLVTQNMFVKFLLVIKKIIHALITNNFSSIVISFSVS